MAERQINGQALRGFSVIEEPSSLSSFEDASSDASTTDVQNNATNLKDGGQAVIERKPRANTLQKETVLLPDLSTNIELTNVDETLSEDESGADGDSAVILLERTEAVLSKTPYRNTVKNDFALANCSADTELTDGDDMSAVYGRNVRTVTLMYKPHIQHLPQSENCSCLRRVPCCRMMMFDDVTEPCCCLGTKKKRARHSDQCETFQTTQATNGQAASTTREPPNMDTAFDDVGSHMDTAFNVLDSHFGEPRCFCLQRRTQTEVELRLERIAKIEERVRAQELIDSAAHGAVADCEADDAGGVHVANEASAKYIFKCPDSLNRAEGETGKLVKTWTGDGGMRWRVEGGETWEYIERDTNVMRHKTIYKDRIPGIFQKDERFWDPEERDDVMMWLYNRETLLSRINKSRRCRVRMEVVDHDVTVACCCCLAWGFCYKRTRPADEAVVFQWYDCLMGVAEMCLYLLDVGTDLWLASTFVHSGDCKYLALTLLFVLLNYVVNGAMTVYTHHRNDEFHGKQRIPVLLAALLNFGPLLLRVRYLYYGCKSRQFGVTQGRRIMCTEKMKAYDNNSCRQRLLEGSLEAAPQLILQLYVLIGTPPQQQGINGVMRVVGLLSSWASLALTVASYTKACRNDNSMRQPADLRNLIFDSLWRLAETGGRVVCIAAFISTFRFWVLAILGPHAVLMALWFCKKNAERGFENNKVVGWLGDILLAYVSIFSFIPKTQILSADAKCFTYTYRISYSNTRVRYIVFYILFYSENLAMLLLWYLRTTNMDQWMHISILTAGLALFPVHVCLQVLYYCCCHPKSQDIRQKSLLPLDFKTWREELWKQDSKEIGGFHFHKYMDRYKIGGYRGTM